MGVSLIQNIMINKFYYPNSLKSGGKNILVLTAYTKEIAWGNYGRNDYAEISIQRNKEYSFANGYDFKYVEHDNINDDIHPTWIKIKEIINHLPLYEYVVWIDADAVFVEDFSLDFMMGKDIALTKCLVAPDFNNTLTTTSTGFMVIHSTDFSIKLFNNLMDQIERFGSGRFKKGHWHEQGMIDEMCVRPQIIQTYRFNDDYYRLVNQSNEDISDIFETTNFKIFPCSYQSDNMDNIKFVYHASADTFTKKERLEKVVNKKNSLVGIDLFLDEFERINFKTIKERHLIVFDSASLGDTIAWIPYVEEYRLKHGTHVILSTFWNNLFEKKYPEIEFVKPGSTVYNIQKQYNIGWYTPWDPNKNPNNYKTIPLQQTASDILGLDFKEIKPKIVMPKGDREILEKYVCISIHSTCQTKYWNYSNGWQEITYYLLQNGYKVVLISKEEDGYMGNYYPKGIIDKHGLNIEDTMNILKYSEMHITISSGLSWLSWAIDIPTIIISGFTSPWFESSQGIERVFNSNVCNSCFNDPNIEFDKGDWNWCPRKKDFECSKKITPDMVIKSINNIRRQNEN